MDLLPIKRAMLSVTDKTGLTELCTALVQNQTELVSTGGTMRHIQDAGLPVTAVSEVTGFPEILGGRVKTLHPLIHAGILADKDNQEHLETLRRMDILAFDLVCVNLYDFAQALNDQKQDRELVEEIDIGGPTLLRAGAKNFHSLTVLPTPESYAQFEAELEKNRGAVSLEFRRRMAARTFALTAGYDTMIARALGQTDL
ncbi:IMP cyclohydrolase [Desulfovermiculus halophilus]|uniref:IMP cyclohydrolase n=1 Tax=Desulfovermiculus halophilus TaxID=339722 RepID=UPI00048A1FE4|nr:IMP cyclohydrolase [Desulfovermiculus halophilus]